MLRAQIEMRENPIDLGGPPVAHGRVYLARLNAVSLVLFCLLSGAMHARTPLGGETNGWGPQRLFEFETDSEVLSHPPPLKVVELPSTRILYPGYDDDHGWEPWFDRGTGSSLLIDLNPGPSNAIPNNNSPLYEFSDVLDGKVYFRAGTIAAGRELWVSDGTPVGTQLFADIRSGEESSDPLNLIVSGANLFFTADDGTSGRELWVTDGTDLTLIDLAPGGADSDPTSLVADGSGGIFFESADAPWYSGGTVATTRRLEEAGTSQVFSPSGALVPLDDDLLAFRSGSNVIVWDDTAGTYRELDSPTVLGDPVAFDGGLFFVALDFPTGRELYQWYLGNPGEPFLVHDLNPGNSSAFASFPVLRLGAGDLFMLADDGSAVGEELYVLNDGDDTPALLADLEPSGDFELEGEILAYDGHSFFSGCLSTGVCRVWVTDGNTVQFPYSATDSTSVVLQSVTSGGFKDGVWAISAEDDQTRLFRADTNLWYPQETFSTTSSSMGIHPGRDPNELLVLANTIQHGTEPWRVMTDGSGSMIEDVIPGPEGMWTFSESIASENHLLFVPRFSDAPEDTHLWDENGLQVAALNFPDEGEAEDLSLLAGQVLLRSLGPGETTQQLFLLDPQTRNSVQLTFGADLEEIYPAGDVAFFTDTDGYLWSTDGTVAGTTLAHPTLKVTSPFICCSAGVLREATPGVQPIFLFLSAEAPRGLYVTDGTEAGTQLVVDQMPGGAPLVTGGLYPDRSGRALLNQHPETLVTDGTPGGTFDLGIGSISSSSVTEHGWFVGISDEVHGDEYGFANGTPGHLEILDLVPGPGSSRIANFFSAADEDFAYLRAWTPERGEELWRSDGTLAGTTPLPEFLPGAASPVVSGLTLHGGRLFMQANGGDGAGTELWMLDVSDIFVDGFESGDLTAWSGAAP